MQPSGSQAYTQLHNKWQVLKTISCAEQSFLKMESVYYDLLILARLQADSLAKERLLTRLAAIQAEKFEPTQKAYPKARQRELFICQFKTALNKDIAAYLRAAKTKNAVEGHLAAVKRVAIAAEPLHT